MRMGALETFHGLLQEHEVVLFMQGTRDKPRCSESAMMVDMLNGQMHDYVAVDVASDPDVRRTVEEHASNGAIPQLFIRQQAVGGCAAVLEMIETGKLSKLLMGMAQPETPVPSVEIREAAIAALRDASFGTETVTVRLRITSHFRHSLDFDRRRQRDLLIPKGPITLVIDPISASRANGITIDFIEDDEGGTFKIDNPQKPLRPRDLDPRDLKEWMEDGTEFSLFDVRTNEERAIASIKGSLSFDSEDGDRLGNLDREVPLVVYCRDGLRSEPVARHCMRLGFRKVYVLDGGIDRWAAQIDTSLPRYRT